MVVKAAPGVSRPGKSSEGLDRESAKVHEKHEARKSRGLAPGARFFATFAFLRVFVIQRYLAAS